MKQQPTYEDANLVLRLYELRREEKMRAAREWFGKNFHAKNLEEIQKIAPMGSQENAYMRMVASYWDMAAALVNRGVLNEELFADTNGEILFVYERMREVLPAIREAFKSPQFMANLEAVAERMLETAKTRSPEWYPMFQQMVHAAGR